MRLIDADLLKEDLSRFYDGWISARELINSQPTVETEWNKEQWNPVGEIYPDEGEIVLIVTPTYTDKEGIEYTESVQCGYYLFPHNPVWFLSDRMAHGNGGILEVKPTHWMQMPKPPKRTVSRNE